MGYSYGCSEFSGEIVAMPRGRGTRAQKLSGKGGVLISNCEFKWLRMLCLLHSIIFSSSHTEIPFLPVPSPLYSCNCLFMKCLLPFLICLILSQNQSSQLPGRQVTHLLIAHPLPSASASSVRCPSCSCNTLDRALVIDCFLSALNQTEFLKGEAYVSYFSQDPQSLERCLENSSLLNTEC